MTWLLRIEHDGLEHQKQALDSFIERERKVPKHVGIHRLVVWEQLKKDNEFEKL